MSGNKQRSVACRKCNAAVWVFERSTCDGCPHRYCGHRGALDDDYCERAARACPGAIAEAGCPHHEGDQDDDECAMGTTYGYGCLIATCATCGAVVEHWPWTDG